MVPITCAQWVDDITQHKTAKFTKKTMYEHEHENTDKHTGNAARRERAVLRQHVGFDIKIALFGRALTTRHRKLVDVAVNRALCCVNALGFVGVSWVARANAEVKVHLAVRASGYDNKHIVERFKQEKRKTNHAKRQETNSRDRSDARVQVW